MPKHEGNRRDTGESAARIGDRAACDQCKRHRTGLDANQHAAGGIAAREKEAGRGDLSRGDW